MKWKKTTKISLNSMKDTNRIKLRSKSDINLQSDRNFSKSTKNKNQVKYSKMSQDFQIKHYKSTFLHI